MGYICMNENNLHSTSGVFIKGKSFLKIVNFSMPIAFLVFTHFMHGFDSMCLAMFALLYISHL